MGQHGDEAVAVAGRAAARARFAFAGNPHSHLIIHTGRDLNLCRHLLEHLTTAAAGRARVLDHRALAMALRACRLDSHDAGRLNHSALTAAVATNFAPAAFGSAGALARGACFMALELDRLRYAVGSLLECERDVAANVAALATLVT